MLTSSTQPLNHRVKPQFAESIWQDVDDMLSVLDELVREPIDDEDFRRRLLSQIAATLGTASAAIWWKTDNELNCLQSVPSSDAVASQRLRLGHAIAEVATTGESIRLESGGNNNSVLYARAVKDIHECYGVLEVLVPSSRDCAELAPILDAVSDVIDERRERTATQANRETAIQAERIDEFATQLHAATGLRHTAVVLANISREFIQCDRVTVLTRGRRGLEVRATSGVDIVNSRSRFVRGVQRLAATASVSGDLWYSGPSDDVSPQLLQHAERILDQAGCREFGIISIRDPQNDVNVLGALFVEYFSSSKSKRAGHIEVVRRHAAIALANAMEVEQVPLWSLWQLLKLRWNVTRKLSSAAIAGLVSVAVIAIALIPTAFTVNATGTLEPTNQKHLFAPITGEVAELHVSHGSLVKAGDPVLRIESAELEAKLQEITGRQKSTRERLAAIQVARVDARGIASEQLHRLSAEHAALSAELVSLDAQLTLLNRQMADATLNSPINGQVITWDVSQRLTRRPVQPGDKLITIAETDGDWELRVRIPDRKAGFVASELARTRQLEVSCVLESEPDREFEGTLRTVANATAELRNVSYVPAVVAIDSRENPTSKRPGAPVQVQIDCGRRALAFVCFHELFYAIRTHLTF
ncbi:MAG: HlyD family efflux transporter periplasmic adaptor subunit [Planctomycetales bacterium]|nr:HlyD family efflux transporter periplasmic adaptor subunit [Planctomycetales bacterium]